MSFNNLQRYEEIPAICENEACDNFKCFELYDVEEVKTDNNKKDYVICYSCKKEVYLKD